MKYYTNRRMSRLWTAYLRYRYASPETLPYGVIRVTAAEPVQTPVREQVRVPVQEQQTATVREIPAKPSAKPFREARIFQSELDFIARCILDCPDIETGGQLFGYWTREGVPVVCYALGPGPKANHQRTFFNQDLGYLQSVGDAIVKHYGLEHIGEWHSHHHLGLAQPSGHDASNIYGNMVKAGRERFLLCIGNCDDRNTGLNAFSFASGVPSYLHAGWTVSPLESPYRAAIDRSMKAFIRHPRTAEAKIEDLKLF